ncbi:uncharacterized protein LOC131249741 [Magnolia sinica]|uniref:uncharacterized protein LOC131249741 n=1 Tax=Magnolia sinica TaxID=86752 RepID=UPI00265A0F6B|nr:uncharacterized protein LOC131249741 [Magnolia sinica]
MELSTLPLLILLFLHPWRILATSPSCRSTCGSLPVKYPLGTGPGCGSPRFQPSVSCAPNDQLLLTTHTGSYPITSVSYATSTLTITPPLMSTCSSMHPSPNFGLDWATPFQVGPSIFLLLSCASPSSSLTYKGTLLCDLSNSHLCSSLYTCPSVSSLGLASFAPSTSCCVYSPANLGPHMDLDVQGLKCGGYASVVSVGDSPSDPTRWEYGVALKFGQGGLDNYNFATACDACEKSDGVCGYSPPRNFFVCVCKNGVNTTSDCVGQVVVDFWNAGPGSGSAPREGRSRWMGISCGADIAVHRAVVDWLEHLVGLAGADLFMAGDIEEVITDTCQRSRPSVKMPWQKYLEYNLKFTFS